MDLSRRELLTTSALLLASPKVAFSATGKAAAGAVAAAGAKPIVLCWNENPYGPSPAARAVLNGTIANACRYPDEEITQLVELLATNEGVSPDHIVVGSGSGELLCALGLLHGRGDGEIIAAAPTYAELTNYAGHAGARLKFVPVDKQLNHDLAGHACRGVGADACRLRLQSEQSDRHRDQRCFHPVVCRVAARLGDDYCRRGLSRLRGR